MYSKTSRNYYRSMRKQYRRTSPLKIVCILLAVALVAFVATYVFCMTVLNKNANENKPETTNEPQTTETSGTVNGSTIAETISMSPIQKDITTPILAKEVATDTAIIESEQKEEELPQIYEGEFELPLQGATVYALANTKLYDESGNKQTVNAGDALRIVSEEGDELVVMDADGFTGKISSYKVMLNLADVVPSIIYRDTNSVASVFQSSGYAIPGVTGEQFYDVQQYNERLGRTEFNMPIIFATAKKVMAAQQMALSEGYSLCIVETYRPMDTQQKVIDNLNMLASTNSDVLHGITDGWDKSWFIAQSISNHQRGYAMDLTLVEVKETEVCTSGDYAYVNVCDYAEVEMPTPIHELSKASATFTKPVPSRDATAWQGKELAPSMNEVAIRLQNYCTSAGFTPLASEWWHFNDLDAMNSSAGSLSDGGYFLQPNLSVIP